ncbi:conserved hypothetical protein [Microcystis aeruginosa PCC 9443]|uniref:Uncharacterized protein n=1 Tax=Microcystis aeruginosa PCC 9443 TaxID=1160281 RepID=I4FZ52_MICAE|nr:conserved hypothetical protein [Microcystis aeruginosa PCC 9443]
MEQFLLFHAQVIGGVLNIFRGLDTMAENLEFSLRCVDALLGKALSLMTEVIIANFINNVYAFQYPTKNRCTILIQPSFAKLVF